MWSCLLLLVCSPFFRFITGYLLLIMLLVNYFIVSWCECRLLNNFWEFQCNDPHVTCDLWPAQSHEQLSSCVYSNICFYTEITQHFSHNQRLITLLVNDTTRALCRTKLLPVTRVLLDTWMLTVKAVYKLLKIWLQTHMTPFTLTFEA